MAKLNQKLVDKMKRLGITMKGVNKKFGTNATMIVADNRKNLEIKRLEDPSVEFGIMLYGGLAVGRIVEYFGEYGSGKTYKAMEDAAKLQKDNPLAVVAWFESEGSFDISAAEQIGIDMSRLLFIPLEEFNGAEDGLEALRAFIESGDIDMAIINSVAGLTPTLEMEKKLSEQQVALQARMMSKLMRVITATLNKNNCTAIFINQLRTNIGVMYGNPNVTTGGRALSFYASQRISFNRNKIDSSDPITALEGIKIRCRVLKNRLASGNPYRDCVYYGRYGVGIDNDIVLPKILIDTGIIRQSGAWLYFDEMNKKWNGKNAFLNDLQNNIQFKEYMKSLVEGKALVSELDENTIKTIEEGNVALKTEMQLPENEN